MVLVRSSPRAVRACCRLNYELKMEFCQGGAGRATVFKAVRDCEGAVDHLESRVFKHSSSSRGCTVKLISPDKPPSPWQLKWENKREGCVTTSKLELAEQQLVWRQTAWDSGLRLVTITHTVGTRFSISDLAYHADHGWGHLWPLCA